MAGVRIQHPTERSCTFTLVDAKRPLVGPQGECGVCHRVHSFKTYHLVLDAAGAAIVSPEIVERLKGMTGQPFDITGEIKAPPAQFVRIGQMPQVPGVVAHPTLIEPL